MAQSALQTFLGVLLLLVGIYLLRIALKGPKTTNKIYLSIFATLITAIGASMLVLAFGPPRP